MVQSQIGKILAQAKKENVRGITMEESENVSSLKNLKLKTCVNDVREY